MTDLDWRANQTRGALDPEGLAVRHFSHSLTLSFSLSGTLIFSHTYTVIVLFPPFLVSPSSSSLSHSLSGSLLPRSFSAPVNLLLSCLRHLAPLLSQILSSSHHSYIPSSPLNHKSNNAPLTQCFFVVGCRPFFKLEVPVICWLMNLAIPGKTLLLL